MEPATAISRRSLFTLSLPRTAPTPAAAPATVIHEDGSYESRLHEGRLASFMQWPAFTLVNQHGQKVDLHRDILAGHPVVLSFFYTQCKGSCPVTTGRMTALATLLAQQQRPARFISITLEPEEDTPAALADYARSILPPAADWHLLTGKIDTITALRRHLGFYDLNPAIDSDPRRHAAMVLIGDTRTHRWITLPAISTLRQWRSALSRCIA